MIAYVLCGGGNDMLTPAIGTGEATGSVALCLGWHGSLMVLALPVGLPLDGVVANTMRVRGARWSLGLDLESAGQAVQARPGRGP